MTVTSARDDPAATLTLTGAADPSTVAHFRHQLAAWLDVTVLVSTECRSDILLATEEALANCADHAYQGHPETGAVAIDVTFDRSLGVVEIRVTDRGRWMPPAPRTQTSRRGRGLILMRAVADELHIDGTDTGTSVRLRFLAGEPPIPENDRTVA